MTKQCASKIKSDQDIEARRNKRQEDSGKAARTDHEVNMPPTSSPAELS